LRNFAFIDRLFVNNVYVFRLVYYFILGLLFCFVSDNDEHRTKAVTLVGFAGDSQILVFLEQVFEKSSLLGVGEGIGFLCISFV
jgi:hypothetical protein